MRPLLSRVGLEGKENQEALTLSDGEKARLSLAMALSKDPSLLLIDELDSHLDEATGERIEAILEKEGERRLVISASHRKEEGPAFLPLRKMAPFWAFRWPERIPRRVDFPEPLAPLRE